MTCSFVFRYQLCDAQDNLSGISRKPGAGLILLFLCMSNYKFLYVEELPTVNFDWSLPVAVCNSVLSYSVL